MGWKNSKILMWKQKKKEPTYNDAAELWKAFLCRQVAEAKPWVQASGPTWIIVRALSIPDMLPTEETLGWL